MDKNSVEIIPFIVRYLDFQQLCIAERINIEFRRHVVRALRSFKVLDFSKVISDPRFYNLILKKIVRYCPKIEVFYALDDLSEKEQEIEKLIWFEPSFLHLKHLNINYKFLKNGQLNVVLHILENRENFTTLNLNVGTVCLTQEALSRIGDALIRQQHLIKFETSFYGQWIDLPVLRYLTTFSFSNYHTMSEKNLSKFYDFLNFNRQIQQLFFTNIKIDIILLETLANMKNLKHLSLYYHVLDEKSPESWQEIDNWSRTNAVVFENLLEFSFIDRYVKRTCSDRKFASIVLSKSPVLKRLRLNVASMRFPNEILTRNIANPLSLECISVSDDDVVYDHPIVAGIYRMLNLRHLHVKNCLDVEDVLNFSTTLKDLKMLQLPDDYYDYTEDYENVLHAFLSNFNLEGLSLDSNLKQIRKSPEIVNWIYSSCSRLRYLSLDDQYITKDQMLLLAEKLPALEYLSISYSSGFRAKLPKVKFRPLFDAQDLISAVENLSRLSVLVLDEKLFGELYEKKTIKNYYRQSKLAIYCHPASARTKKCKQRILGECSEYKL